MAKKKLPTRKMVFTGKILKAGCYPLPEPDQHKNTHRLSIQLDNKDKTWVNMGNTTHDQFLVKNDEDKWKILGAGSEINLTYEDVKLESGKIISSSGKSRMTVLTLVEGQKYEEKEAGASSTGKTSGTKKGYDTSGQETGGAINMAFAITGYRTSKILNEAKQLHSIVQKLKADYVKAHPGVSEYDAGQTVGNAVSNVCHFIAGSDKYTIKDVEKLSKAVLTTLSAPMLEYVKSTKEQAKSNEEDGFSSDDDGFGTDASGQEDDDFSIPDQDSDDFEEEASSGSDDGFDDDVPF